MASETRGGGWGEICTLGVPICMHGFAGAFYHNGHLENFPSSRHLRQQKMLMPNEHPEPELHTSKVNSTPFAFSKKKRKVTHQAELLSTLREIGGEANCR